MFLFRWLSGLPLAAAVTLGLFFLMSQMIRTTASMLDLPSLHVELTITAREQPEGPVKSKNPPKQIKEEMPKTVIEFPKPTGKGDTIPTNPGPVKISPTPPGGGGASTPLIRIAPAYPEACRSRNAQGVVIVEFDVTPEGNVINPRIVETADRCFDRTVIKTVSGWKYPPASGGGMRYGAVERFNFQLTE
ncbi:MAG: TonB family protein [Parvularculaceae bacterium]